jgi:hypothetical protein
MGGTAIAVALVPPVCVMGIMLAAGELDDAQGAGLLFSANLLGILIGGITVLATREPYFREKLRTQNRSRLPLLIALILAFVVGDKLYGRLKRHVYAVKIEDAKERIEGGIRSFLKRQTSTFGNNKSLDVASISFDWPDYWERHRSPQLQVVVRVTDPTTPSYTQVQYIQDRINERMEREFPGLQLQMEVHRINMTVISGNDVTSEPTKLNLERILGQEIIQKIPPPESDNKAEDKINTQADIDPEIPNAISR